jgi:hypothetical protein
MSRCNHCTLKAIRVYAKKENKKVTMLPSNFLLGGREVYTHPKDIKISKLLPKDREQYFAAWLMEVTEYCCC